MEVVKIAKDSTSDSAAHDYQEALKVFQSGLGTLEIDSLEMRIREVLTHLVTSNDYPWKQFSNRGRKWVLGRLSPNELQSFTAAGLTKDMMDDQIREWWDALASRNTVESPDFGFRIWEKRSFEKELERLSKEKCPLFPEWVALEDNFMGYDILTYHKTRGGWQKHYLEVKSSETGITRFYLSHREAAIATRFTENYSLDFWDVKSGTLRQLSGNELLAHLPINQGQGKWQEVLVTIT
jgi:hypothetical protein